MRLLYIILIAIGVLLPSCMKRKSPKAELKRLIQKNPELIHSSDTIITYDTTKVPAVIIEATLQPHILKKDIDSILLPISNTSEKKAVESNISAYFEKYKPPDINLKNGDLSLKTYKTPEGETKIKAVREARNEIKPTKTIQTTLQDTTPFWRKEGFWIAFSYVAIPILILFFGLRAKNYEKRN